MKEWQQDFLEAIFENKSYPIYYNNFIGSHMKALKEIYNIIYKLIGEECFENLAKIYIPQNLSYSYQLQNYGRHFANFLAKFLPLKQLPYLADLAELEWAIHELYYIPEESWENTKFVQSIYPILSIWEFGKNPDDKILDIQTLPGENIMLRRKGTEIIFIRANLS